jgi:hypothetical protein
MPHTNITVFNWVLESKFHAHIHDSIGGTMATDDAASAPEFFLLHSFVDNIWFEWQKS